jgi:hypothetical protein
MARLIYRVAQAKFRNFSNVFGWMERENDM